MKSTIFSVMLFLLVNILLPAEVQLTILKGEAVNEKKARLFVMAFDETGRPVKELSKENFKLKVEGEEIENFEVESVSATESPLSIILGIDVSGSMKGRPFSETRRSISRFLDQLDKKDYISLMTFGTKVNFLTDFSDKRYEIRERMEGLAAVDQWTHLYDATCEALNRVQKSAPTTKKAVVMITDGKDEGSTTGRAEAVDKALVTAVPIFALGFGHKIDREYLRDIGKVSGGYFLYTPDPEEITKLYDKVLDMLKSEYAVVFDFSKNPGQYRANLVLDYRDQVGEAYKEFLFNPSGLPVMISEPSREEDAAAKSWLQRVPLELLVLLLIVLLAITFVILWLRARLTEKRFTRITESISRESSPECELEFPKDLHATKAGYFESFSSIEKDGDATKYTELPNVFLQVDCFRGRFIPLVYEGTDMLEELIIARKTGDEKEKGCMKQNSAYLLAASGKQVISRPNERRYGHARIFLTEGENYAVEDLGSKVGTFVNNKSIREVGAAVLQDGDVIEVGGKAGIRIVYRESGSGSMERDYSEQTTMRGD